MDIASFFLKRRRTHVEGKTKVWMEPNIELHSSFGFSSRQINIILEQIEKHSDEIREHWNNHFRDFDRGH